MAKNNLVIVESPAKAKTLGRMLGKGYTIKASIGHIRDLPKSRIGVDVEKNFTPKYVVSREKKAVVKELKEQASKSKAVILATDPDREGEAIAWHLAETISSEQTVLQRVIFHEITDSAIAEAFKNPRSIDMNLVNAQQARRIVDRLVGYKLSPLLWSKIRRGLSAGRVQSVAVKLIVDREREIEKFVPTEYWSIEAQLLKKGSLKTPFRAALVGLSGGKKMRINNQKTSEAITAELRQAEFSVCGTNIKQTKRSPAPPFITSTLQQEAWRHFHFSAKKTMTLAQQLYEGLPIGTEGNVGLITYMRTDSTHTSTQAIAETREYISSKFGKKNLHSKTRFFAQKAKGAQEAHEAIRPTSVLREPTTLKAVLSNDQHKLYQLIWKRMVASQMADAVFNNTTVDIDANNTTSKNKYLLRSSSITNVFPGFISLYSEQNDEENSDKKTALPIPKLDKGDSLTLKDLSAEQNFTKPPMRYTEATLIKTLEQNGIGRPSTYAPIMTTIQDREYIKKSTGAFMPTELGFTVTDMLVEHFSSIINTEYTAHMENELDRIAEAEIDWVETIRAFYLPLEQSLADAKDKIERIEIPDEMTGENCPECGQALVYKVGRFGKFITCSGYPECKYHTNFRINTDVPCPDCPEGGKLIGRYNKKGKIFYGCSAFPKHKFATNFKPLKQPCPKCGKLQVASGANNTRCLSCNNKNKLAEE